MSKGHTAVNEFLKKKERYADFFNGIFFQGQRVVLPEELEVIKGESDILVEDKEKKLCNRRNLAIRNYIKKRNSKRRSGGRYEYV